MSTPVTVWESLQTQGQAVAKGVAYIDPDTLQPNVDVPDFTYDPATKIFKPKILDLGDYIATAKKLGIWRVIGASAAPVSAGVASVAEDILAVVTIPANSMGPNGIIRAWANWSYTNNGNNKTGRIRYSANGGGTGGTLYYSQVVSATNTLKALATIQNRNAINSQLGGTSDLSFFGASASTYQISAFDTSLARDIVFTGQKASAGDTLTLESYLVELLSKD